LFFLQAALNSPSQQVNTELQILKMSGKKNGRKRKRVPMDMRTRGRKKKKAVAKIDYLTNMAPNILLRILSHVPMKSFLDLYQTHPQLRRLMRSHASTICNFTILERFPFEAWKFEAKDVQGWLTPTAGLICGKPRKDTGLVVPGLQLQLYEPGPHFLFFLEKQVLQFDSEGKVIGDMMAAIQKFMNELNKETPVVYGGQDYPCWVWLREMVWYHGVPS
jgi:hypothetical protein